ncbi:MAG: hypothetical protein ACSLE0_14730 [Chitinophagaceae bacterium]
MKLIKLNAITKSISVVMIMLFAMVVAQSCSNKIAFATSSVVPAAEGSIKVKKDKNSNYNIELSVMRLSDPKRLNPPKEKYVVWMDTESNGTKNIGQLNTSSGLFSSTLKSSLKTVTPYKPVRIFITAEDNADIQYATGQRVLETSNF